MNETFSIGDRVRYILPIYDVRPLHSEGTLMRPIGKVGWYVKWDATGRWNVWTQNRHLELIIDESYYKPDLV